MKMSTSSGGLSSGPVGGERGATVAAVAADSTATVDIVEMAACPRSCSETASAKDSSLKLQLLHVGDSRLQCDVSAGRVRPLVPAALRRRVFDQLHGITHPGVRATRRLIAARFVWPAMAADVAVWCRDCVACNRAKITRHVQRQSSRWRCHVGDFHTYTWTSWGLSQDWVSQLPWVLLGLRAAPKEKANISSAEMVYGTALTLPGEFLDTPEAGEVGGEVEVRGYLFLPT
jgi:hypothetical protein